MIEDLLFMKEFKKIAALGFLLMGSVVYGQSYFEPNYALKSPMTLEIINVELNLNETVINASIENRIDGGYFCIDPETYIISNRGEKLKMSKLTGLPLCPAQYKFREIGEIKFITLKFPPLEKGTEWLDIMEECGDNCVAVYGLCLDQSINAEINICFRDIEKGRLEDAIERFENLRQGKVPADNPILGSVYLNLVSLYKQSDQPQKAEALANEFKGLLIPHKEKFLKNLED